MNPLRETLLLLKENGYVLLREGTNHTLYINPENKKTIPVKRHGFNENTRDYILKEAGIKRKKK